MFTHHPREPQIFLGQRPDPWCFDHEAPEYSRLLAEVVHGLNVEYRGAPVSSATLRAIEASANRTIAFFDATEGTRFSSWRFEARYELGNDVVLDLVSASPSFLERIARALYTVTKGN